MTSLIAPSYEQSQAARLTRPALPTGRIVDRLREAGAALQRQAALRPTTPITARRPRHLWIGIGSVLVLVLAISQLRFTAIPNAVPGTQQSIFTSDAPPSLELRARQDNPGTSVESLSDNIRGYYSRIPGGFQAAVRSAQQASRAHPLDCFSQLPYHLLDQGSRVVIGTLPGDGFASTASRALGQYCPEQRCAFIIANLTPKETQEVREHELTHAWQFLGCVESDLNRIHCWQYRFCLPLGNGPDQAKMTRSIFDSDKKAKKPSIHFLRDYLCRPIEIDPRLGALKRWWARNQGELLDTTEKARQAFEHPQTGNLLSWPDVSGAWLIWDSYRNQPDVQQLLLLRIMQLL